MNTTKAISALFIICLMASTCLAADSLSLRSSATEDKIVNINSNGFNGGGYIKDGLYTYAVRQNHGAWEIRKQFLDSRGVWNDANMNYNPELGQVTFSWFNITANVVNSRGGR